MSRVKRHLISLGLMAALGLLSAAWVAGAAAIDANGTRVLTSVPHPVPDPHP